MREFKLVLVVLFAIAAVSCSKDQEIKVYSVSYSFKDSLSGWTADFADYPVVDSAVYYLHAKLDTLPGDTTKKAFLISGINEDKDLFMFIKRKFTGLRRNTSYKLLFNTRFASNAHTGSTTAGGAPGDSVYVKVGASAEEPLPIVMGEYYRLNIDKGNQELGGENMIVLGHIGVAATTTKYTIINRFNTAARSNLVVTTNDAGELWLIVGTDSGHKGRTTLYYTQVDVLFNEVD
jgi:hypothetical protein